MNDENRRKRDVFYGVVAIATLIIAMIGATLAYFSITASSDTGAVNAKSAIVSIDYQDSQQVTLQADKLIPSSFDVVKTVYGSKVFGLTEEDLASKAEVTDAETDCLDSNGRQVCSTYRFSVSVAEDSDPIEIIALLNVDMNTFEYAFGEEIGLSYALYHVTGEEYSESNWIPMKSHLDAGTPVADTYYAHTKRTCQGEGEEECYTITGSKRTYLDDQKFSMFGTTLNSSSEYENNTVSINSGTTETYDLVIFYDNADDDQNIDQGKEFQGTIVVSLADSADQKIQGYVSE